MRIVTADERLAEHKGVKILITGPVGVGKTSLLRGLKLKSTLFVDIEAGDLAVADLVVDTVRPRSWPEFRDLACALGGPNPAVAEGGVYSQEHYDAVVGQFSDLKRYDTIFVDSITAASRLSFVYAAQQPEAFTERGRKDLRGTFGLHAREMIAALSELQHARALAVIFVAILEQVTDDVGRTSWGIQMEGQRTARELPGIIDEILTMNWISFDGSEPVRAFITSNPNQWSWPGKDRSGRLELIEEPDLGKLIAKITAPRADRVEPQVKAKGGKL